MVERTFADGPLEVVVLPEVGARLHRLRAYGHDVLRTPPDLDTYAREPFFWGSYVMAPWCNRIETTPVRIGEREMALAANFSDGSAIHGQVYARPWEDEGNGVFRVRGGRDGWPWEYEVSLAVTVTAPSVQLRYTLANLSQDPMPAGIGIHPLFRKPVQVAINGSSVFSPNTDTPPHPEPAAGALDMRQMRAMADDLDATWTDLSDPPVELSWPDAGIRATMRAAAPSLFVSVASLGFLQSVAVEPETHAPQGLRRLLHGEPGGLTMLGGGDNLSLTVELTFERIYV